MPKKNEEENIKSFVKGSLLTFLFSNALLLIFGLFKTKGKKK